MQDVVFFSLRRWRANTLVSGGGTIHYTACWGTLKKTVEGSKGLNDEDVVGIMSAVSAQAHITEIRIWYDSIYGHCCHTYKYIGLPYY